MGSVRSKQRSKRKKRVGPKSTDYHWLYQTAVQSPDVNVKFFDRVYKARNGRLPALLKEDFCGTALLAAQWVRTRDDNMAYGVDLDQPTLDWGMEQNIVPLGGDASRVKLIKDDVRSVKEPKVDIVAALNFSYFIFKTPAELTGYFESVRGSLKDDGIFVLDIFGGWESHMDLKDRTRHRGFTYVWEQKGLDPLTNEGRFHIHFDFHGGGGIKDAFVYNWRLWSIPEVRECLQGAGFKSVDVYWEGTEKDTGEGNGVFRKVTKVENMPGWHTFMVAF